MIQIGAASLSIKETGYTEIKLLPELSETLTRENAKELCERIYELNNGETTYILINGIEAAGIHPEKGVNEEFIVNKKYNEIVNAQAYVFTSLGIRIFIHLYISLNRKRNIKVFKKEDLAIKWLLEQKNNEQLSAKA